MHPLSLVPSNSSSVPESDIDFKIRACLATLDAWQVTPEGVAPDSAVLVADKACGAAAVAIGKALNPDNRRLADARRVANMLTGAEREAALVVVDEIVAERAVMRARVLLLITATRKSAEAEAAWAASLAAHWAGRAADSR